MGDISIVYLLVKHNSNESNKTNKKTFSRRSKFIQCKIILCNMVIKLMDVVIKNEFHLY
jgi:hypothetical protein